MPLPIKARLQEAYRNTDGTYSKPHWDEVFNPQSQLLCDSESVKCYIDAKGAWIEAFCNEDVPGEDKRMACRRIIDVEWAPGEEPKEPKEPVVVTLYDELLDFVLNIQHGGLLFCNCGTECDGTCFFATMNKLLEKCGHPVTAD